MPSLPRPKLFRRRKDKTEPSPISKFYNNIISFFTVVFVTKTNREPSAEKVKSRESIVKKIRRLRKKNKVGVLPSGVELKKDARLECKFISYSYLFYFAISLSNIFFNLL